MTGPQKTLLLIGAFLTLMIGSFIWFVVSWDAAKEEPVSALWQLETSA